MSYRIIGSIAIAASLLTPAALQWIIGEPPPLDLAAGLTAHTAAQGLFAMWAVWWIRCFAA